MNGIAVGRLVMYVGRITRDGPRLGAVGVVVEGLAPRLGIDAVTSQLATRNCYVCDFDGVPRSQYRPQTIVPLPPGEAEVGQVEEAVQA